MFRLSFTLMYRHVFIDVEWTLDQNIFLLSYAYLNGPAASLHSSKLNRRSVKRILRKVYYIYVYGPDIAMLEKNFPANYKKKFVCVNMLRLVKHFLPGLDSYKLEYIEKLFKLNRSTRKYKTSVFTIWKHWFNPLKREHVIRYNLEDAKNLRSLYLELKKRGLQLHHIMSARLS